MSSIPARIRDFLLPPRMDGRVIFLWNPPIAAGMTLVFEDGDYLWSFFVTWAIATIVTSVCLAAVAFARRVIKVRSRLAQLGLALLAAPAGLHLAFVLAELATGAAGIAWRRPGLSGYRFGLFFAMVVAGIFLLWHARLEAREAARVAALRLERERSQRLQAQLAALTAQLNPHLLFNALNTVASLIPTEPARAEEVVLELAEFYRAVLASREAVVHPLAHELRICEAYLEVEQARFGPRLRTSVDVPAALASLEVPVLLLQPLVENAIQHGLAARSAGGSIAIRAHADGDRASLVVEDDGVGPAGSDHRGAGVGLSNCRERLRLLYGDAAALSIGPREGGGTRVSIRLPLAREAAA